MIAYVYVTAFAGNLLSFSIGAARTWSSPEQYKLSNTTTTPFTSVPTAEELSWIIASLPLGSIIGPIFSSFLSDLIGRKFSLWIFGIPICIGYFMLTFGKIVIIFYAAQVMIGLGVGAAMALIPVYFSEISEKERRGALTSSIFFSTDLGSLFSYCVGPFVSVAIFNSINAFIAFVFLLLFVLIAPESPYYFVQKYETFNAVRSLKQLRSVSIDLHKELEEIKHITEHSKTSNLSDLIRKKPVRRAFLIALMLGLFRQLSGNNPIMFYSQKIFETSNVNLRPEICAIIIGCVNLATSLITVAFVDKIGRRKLLIISATGMAVSHFVLGTYLLLLEHNLHMITFDFVPILAQVSYIICFGTGFGSIPMTVMGEIFPTHVKSFAASVCTIIELFVVFIIIKYFPNLVNIMGMGGLFLIFAGFCVLAALFSVFFVIETKGKSLFDIQNDLRALY